MIKYHRNNFFYILRALFFSFSLSTMLVSCSLFNIRTTENSPPADLLPLEDFSAEQHCNFGVVFENRNDIESAIIEYKKAIELDNNFSLAYANLANCYNKLGDYSNAINNYSIAITKDSTNYLALNNLADLNIDLNQNFNYSIKLINKALDVDTINSKVYYFNLSRAFEKNNNLNMALSMADSALFFSNERDHIYSKLLFQKGKILYTLNSYKQSLFYLNKTLEINPKFEQKENVLLLINEVSTYSK